MTPATKLTKSEQQALMDALARSFGHCACQRAPYSDEVRYCAGHQFLRERDRIVGRIDKLLWIRRTADKWQHAEQMGTCKECGQQAYHVPGEDRCVTCGIIAVHDTPSPSLPW